MPICRGWHAQSRAKELLARSIDTLNGFLKFRNAVAAFKDMSVHMVILDEVVHAVWFLVHRKHEDIDVRSIPKNFYQ